MARPDPSRVLRALVPEPGPQRVYGWATLVNTIGFGLYLPSVILYLTQVLHLPSAQVGLGLTVSGMVALLVAIPAGDMADRLGPREMVRWTTILQAVSSFAYLFIHGFGEFLAL